MREGGERCPLIIRLLKKKRDIDRGFIRSTKSRERRRNNTNKTALLSCGLLAGSCNFADRSDSFSSLLEDWPCNLAQAAWTRLGSQVDAPVKGNAILKH